MVGRRRSANAELHWVMITVTD